MYISNIVNIIIIIALIKQNDLTMKKWSCRSQYKHINNREVSFGNLKEELRQILRFISGDDITNMLKGIKN